MFSQELGQAIVPIRATLDGLKGDLEQANRTVSESLKQVGDSAKNFGQRITLGISLPIAGAAAGAAKMSMDFNGAMANVATLIPGNTDKITGLGDAIKDMSIVTGKATGDLASGLYQVISAGVDVGGAVDVLGVAAKSAAAGLTDTNTAVDAITSALNAYGLQAGEAGGVSDVLLTTVRLGKTTFGELGSSIGQVIPLAAQTGISFEDLNAAIVAMTAVGIKTPQAMSGMRAAISNILKPSADAAKAAARLGIEFDAQALKSKGLVPFLQEIKDKTGGNTDAMTALFGSVEGVNAILALTSDQGVAKLTAAQQEMQNATGATDEAFKQQTTGANAAGFAWTQFRRELEKTAINMGNSLGPALTKILASLQPVIGAVASAVQWFSNLDPRVQSIIIGATALVVALGPVMTVIGTVTSAIGAVVSVGGALAGILGSIATVIAPLLMGALSFLISPIGLVVMAIAAVIAIGVLLYKNWDTISAWLSQTWERIRQTGEAVWNGIKGFFVKWWPELLIAFTGPIGALVVLVVKNWDTIKQATSDAWNGVKDLTSSIWDGIVVTIKGAINGIIGGINWFIRAMNSIHITVPEVEIPLVGKVGGWSIGLPHIPEIPMLAAGGIAMAPTLAMIGEAGPEAVVPLSQLGLAGAGGPTIVVTGNTFMSEYDMDRFINQKLMPAVQRVFELRGPYRG